MCYWAQGQAIQIIEVHFDFLAIRNLCCSTNCEHLVPELCQNIPQDTSTFTWLFQTISTNHFNKQYRIQHFGITKDFNDIFNMRSDGQLSLIDQKLFRADVQLAVPTSCLGTLCFGRVSFQSPHRLVYSHHPPYYVREATLYCK